MAAESNLSRRISEFVGVALFALFATARTGYGELEHSFALQPIHTIILYVGFGVLTGFAAFAAYSTLRGRRVLHLVGNGNRLQP